MIIYKKKTCLANNIDMYISTLVNKVFGFDSAVLGWNL